MDHLNLIKIMLLVNLIIVTVIIIIIKLNLVTAYQVIKEGLFSLMLLRLQFLIIFVFL